MREIRQLWSHRVSIRVRLTLLYLLSLGLMLFLFAGFIQRLMEISLQSQADTALELAATQVLGHVGEDDGRLAFENTDALRRITKDFDLYLVAPDGTVWDSLGYGDAPFLESPNTGYSTIKEGLRRRAVEWRIFSQQVILPDSATTGWLQVAQSLDYRDATLRSLTGHICFALPLLLILAGGGSFLLASRALRPIDKITQTARAINASDLEGRINYEGANDEVGRLARTFDSMLDRLQGGFERERRFTADAAHELRTPLTALKGRIGVTLSQPRQPTAYEDALREMEGQVDRLVRLSNDLLFMARLDHREGGPPLDAIALSDLLAALVDQVRPLAEAKAIVLAESVPPGLMVKGDMDLLIRLFLNLLDNAIKYTPSAGKIKVQAEKRADRICVSISDTGPGIPPEQLPHLFERFYRVERDRVRHSGQHFQAQGGAGLGLAIAQEIARAHGGTLTVQSDLGKGSTFTFCMPVPS